MDKPLVWQLSATGALIAAFVIAFQILQHGNHYHLASAVHTSSPNSKIRFDAATDGTMQLIEVQTGRVIHQQRILPYDYNSVTATWITPQQVKIYAPLRYPAMAKARNFVWDVNTEYRKSKRPLIQ